MIVFRFRISMAIISEAKNVYTACLVSTGIIAPAVPAKVQKVGEILGAVFTGTETPEEIGHFTADAYIAFRDEKVDLNSLSQWNIDAAAVGVFWLRRVRV